MNTVGFKFGVIVNKAEVSILGVQWTYESLLLGKYQGMELMGLKDLQKFVLLRIVAKYFPKTCP